MTKQDIGKYEKLLVYGTLIGAMLCWLITGSLPPIRFVALIYIGIFASIWLESYD